MRNLIPFCLGLIAVFNISAQDLSSSTDSVITVTNVNVITMANEEILTNKTVRIQKGKIISIEDSTKQTIDKGKVIDASDMYLFPGLHDMHTHVVTTSFAKALGIEDKYSQLPYEELLTVYLVNGITTIQVLSGGEDLLQLRESIQKGTTIGPKIILASPMVDGNPPILPEPFVISISYESQVEKIMRDIKIQGYDFVKLRVNLSKPIFDEIVKWSKKLKLPLIGHVPRKDGLSLDYVVKSKNFGIAHLEEFGYVNSSPTEDDIDEYIQLIKENKGFVITTLNVFDNIIDKMEDYDATLKKPNAKYVHPLFKTLWLNNPFKQKITGDRLNYIKEQLIIQQKLVYAFYKANVPIMLGTDALNPTIIPGFSIHRELELIMESGLSSYEALRMATVIPARHLDPSNKQAGTIQIGQTANLLLLKGNPLFDISNLESPDMVIKEDVIFTKEDLEHNLKVLERILKK